MNSLSETSLGAIQLVVSRFDPLRNCVRGAMRASYPRRRTFLATRDELPLLLNRRGLLGRGVEVGVKKGEFSERLLDLWLGGPLISIDPWSSAEPDEYVDVANVEQQAHDAFYETTCDRLARFGERSDIWRMLSTQAAERVPAVSLDLAYLDARHDYASVLEDLAAWIGKVRPGGIIAGHDYIDGNFPEGVFGVKSAVDEFFAARGLRARVTIGDPPWRSWYVVLPAGAD